MGQQQLLLILLGTIVVGVAVVVGINLFTANGIEAKRNNIVNDLIHLGSEAQKYYKTPEAMGGGSQKFTGWEIPKKLEKNANGTFTATVSANNIIIIGTGNQVVTGNDSVKVKAVVTADSIRTQKIN